MGIATAAVVLVLAACDTTMPPSPPAQQPPERVRAWAEGAKDMVWLHTRPGPPPALPLARLETCGDYAIAFFDDPGDEGSLWAAGSLSEPPEGADGGFVESTDAADLQTRREANGPCTVTQAAP